MIRAKSFIKTITFLSILCILICLNSNHFVFAQTWQALPPYNFLWPLWSSALSPVDPATGLKTPIVSDLYWNTILPIQPGLVWNPIFTDPYLIYNSPVGLQYYDVIYGINPWPPSYSIDPVTGSPIPLNLPVGYQYLPVTDSAWIQQNIPLGNLAYLEQYPTWALSAYNANLPANLSGLNSSLASLVYPTPALTSLLTPGQILGYTPVTSAQLVSAPTVVVAPSPTIAVSAPPVVPPTPVVTSPTAPLPVSTFNPATTFFALLFLGLL